MAPAAKRRTQDERSAITRNKLAKAAFEAIRDGGYGGLRTAAVAKSAGVSQGGQLHHYATKEELAFAATHYGFAQAEATAARNLQKFADGDGSPVDPVRALLDDSLDFYFSGAFEVAIDVVKGTQLPELRRQVAQVSRKFREFAERGWLEHLVAHGWAKADAQDVIDLSTSIVRGFAIRKWIHRDTGQYQRLLERWVTMVYAACPPQAANGSGAIVRKATTKKRAASAALR